MCRLLGVHSKGPVYYDLFEEFADLARKGNVPIGGADERGHGEGWGVACFQNGIVKFHDRDAGSALDSSKYYGISWKIAKLNIERKEDQSLVVLGHLCRASGRRFVAREWSQPFLQERAGVMWAFQHTGSLASRVRDPEKTDSQVIFELFLEVLEGHDHEAVKRATTTVRNRAIDEYGGFTALNFMLTDGETVHMYRDFTTNGRHFRLHLEHLGEMVVMASEPLLEMKPEPVPRGILHTVTPDLRIRRSMIA